jgi:acyl-coenzyme A synthetase/AMP-(fatty) acid ligase
MSGYWNDEERNRQVLVRPEGGGGGDGRPYFRTGDRARLLDDGNLAFVARADRQVKVRGHRVELDEVEGALLSLDAVEEAAVFTVPDEEGSSALWAAIVAGQQAPVSERELLAGLREILPPHAVPARLDIVGSMPRTPTGKVDTRMLIAQAMERVSHDGR